MTLSRITHLTLGLLLALHTTLARQTLTQYVKEDLRSVTNNQTDEWIVKEKFKENSVLEEKSEVWSGVEDEGEVWNGVEDEGDGWSLVEDEGDRWREEWVVREAVKEDMTEELFRLQLVLEQQVDAHRLEKRQQSRNSWVNGARGGGGGGGARAPLHDLIASTRASILDLASLYLPRPLDANPQCRRDIATLYLALIEIEALMKNNTMWPLLMVDAWGKYTDGLLAGQRNLLGSFKQCLDVTAGRNLFKGQYCFVSYQAAPNSTSGEEEGPWGDAGALDASVRAPMVSLNVPGFLALLSSYSTCMPDSCTADELRASVGRELGGRGYQVVEVDCQVKDQHHLLEPQEIAGCVVLGVLGLVLVAATALDVWTARRNPHLRQGPMKYLLVFSASANLQKLFHLDTSANPRVISCMHGVRFLSICWVVLGHQYAYSAGLASNLYQLPEEASSAAFQMIANGGLSVDTFFLLSAVLVTLALLKQHHQGHQFNPLVYVLHRVVRLLPAIAVCDLVMATVSGLLVSGPLEPLYRSYYLHGCRHSFWLDLTLMSNLIYPRQYDKEGASTCLPQCWYVGADTQMYLVAPLLVLPLAAWGRRGEVWLAVCTVASFVIPTAIIAAYHLWPTSMLLLDAGASLEYTHRVYLMPWCRAAPYLVGVWAGVALHHTTNNPGASKLKKWQVALGWGVCVVVGACAVFGISRYNKPVAGVPTMSVVEAALYGGLHRGLWGAAVAWIILACHWGYGGPVNWLLSHPCWQPLSRLTYCIYLTSLPVQFAVLYSSQTTHYYTHLAKVQEACGVMLIVILVSVAVTLITESPIITLEKMLLAPPGRTDDRRTLVECRGQASSSAAVNVTQAPDGVEAGTGIHSHTNNNQDSGINNPGFVSS